MRKIAPFLAVAAILSLLPFVSSPVGPREALALDDPALVDGGALIILTDAGTLIVTDTARTSSWNMAIRCDPAAYYRMCEANTTTCAPTTAYAHLDQQKTFDIGVPSNRRYLGLLFVSTTSSDGGMPTASVQIVTP